ncbi:MAG: hypothetical protein DWQ07_19870 [Chloroflexi bacterium]|nr:MAG: hypothetical protein DWQ07_19870 [Chloroflexota bacterium]MBL1194342.1 hypothetical protein [Chloroflexota bacterium]NOH11632.1 hypothetical protein [Chloroflexota bacterium]
MNFLGLTFVVFFLVLMGALWVFVRSQDVQHLRQIDAFTRLQNAIALAVEDGSRLHVSLGHGNLVELQAASALIGLHMLQRVVRVASDSDQPPIATSGNGVTALLAQDTLRAAYQGIRRSEIYDPGQARIPGLTPFSFTVGVVPMIDDEAISTSILAGSFGEEVGLITTAADRSNGLTLAGSEDLTAQAVFYASAGEPLIGEELYAAGAYLEAGDIHTASLHAQDILRWIIILVILGSAVVGFFLGLTS